MKHIKSSEAAKAFGQLVSDVQAEPVTIESYGRPVAVIYSYREAQEMEALKLAHLKALVSEGLESIKQGRVRPLTKDVLNEIKAKGRKRL